MWYYLSDLFMMNLYIHSAVQLLVKFNMADLKGHLIAKKVETWFVTEHAFYIYYFYDFEAH